MDNLSQAIQGLTDRIDRRKMQDLGKQFLATGDFTPQGLQKFATENNLTLEQMQGLVQTVALFNQWKQQAYQQELGQKPLSSLKGPDGGINPEATIDQIKGASAALPYAFGKAGQKVKMTKIRPDGTKHSLEVDPGQVEAYGKLGYEQGTLDRGPNPSAVKAYVGPNGDIKYLPNNQTPPSGYLPYSQGMDIEVGPEGTKIRTNVGRGKTDLTQGATTETQKDVIGMEAQLQDLKALKDDYKREYLTYLGRGKRAALNQASKLGMDIGEGNKEYVEGARKFQEGVEQVFNSYRKEITGAQAAMKEISMLRDSILNKNLSPDEFEASYDRYISQIKRTLRLKKSLLEQGLSGDAMWQKLDEMFVNGEDIQQEGSSRFKILSVE